MVNSIAIKNHGIRHPCGEGKWGRSLSQADSRTLAAHREDTSLSTGAKTFSSLHLALWQRLGCPPQNPGMQGALVLSRHHIAGPAFPLHDLRDS